MKSKYLSISLASMICSFLSLGVKAQKLPNVQVTAAKAPVGIKIDGKTTEWNDQFQAYNRAAEIFYTVSDDSSRLYFTVKAVKPEIINKIMSGGISFAIQPSGKKNDRKAIAITYPVFERQNRPSYHASVNLTMKNGLTHVTTNYPQVNDSTVLVWNQQLAQRSKEIAVTGLPGLDTLISVYNEDGIKTGQRFDAQGSYVYELAVDLKLLGDIKTFAYHVTLNGVNLFAGMMGGRKTTGGDGTAPNSDELNAIMAEMTAKVNAATGNLNAPTDFWGEYNLVKNP